MVHPMHDDFFNNFFILLACLMLAFISPTLAGIVAGVVLLFYVFGKLSNE